MSSPNPNTRGAGIRGKRLLHLPLLSLPFLFLFPVDETGETNREGEGGKQDDGAEGSLLS